MSHTIKTKQVNHVNCVMEDYEVSLAFFQNTYDAEYLLHVGKEDAYACLFQIGRVIFEQFSPRMWLLNSRYGAHYLGIEFQVESLDVARAALTEHKVRIARDITVAVHCHPEDCYGVSLEFWENEFHTMEYEALGGKQMQSATFWADEHPLGLTGLKGITWAVHDIAGARAFLESLLGAKLVYETDRPHLAARATGLQIADTVVELLSPTGPGDLTSYLARWGDGIRSTIFAARDLDRVRKFLEAKGLPLVAGTAPGTLAVPAEANRGMLFEFAA